MKRPDRHQDSLNAEICIFLQICEICWVWFIESGLIEVAYMFNFKSNISWPNLTTLDTPIKTNSESDFADLQIFRESPRSVNLGSHEGP